MEGAGEYFTHPDRMRGAPGRKQNAMMHLQLKSFEGLLQTFLEKHETGSLYRTFAKVIPHNRHVNTLDRLNDYTNRWFSDLEDRHLNDQSTMQRIEEFNQDIKYLKDMKTTFDERIYSVLFEFYYELVMEEIPQATKLVERGRRASSEIKGSNLLVMSNTKGYDALNESMPVRKLYDISKDCEKLFLIIHQLQLVDVRWGSLLKSEELDVQLFDPDSFHDVKLYPDYYRFGELLRLIPDIMHKTQNAIKLARSWWYQAERIRRRLRGQKIREDTTSDPPLEGDDIYVAESPQEHESTAAKEPKEDHSAIPYRPHSPQKYHSLDEYDNPKTDYRNDETQNNESEEEVSERPPERIPYGKKDSPLLSRTPRGLDFETHHQTFPAVKETVEQRLKELTTSIALRRMELASETNELEFFDRRKQRIRKLRSNMKLADNAIEAMEDELKTYTRVKERLILQLEEAEDYSERRHISDKLKTIDQKVNDIQELSKVSKYRQKLMNSDLKLKLDLKATFTRYQNEVQGRSDLLTSSVQEEEEKKDQLEHELMLLHLQDGLDGHDHKGSKDKGILHKTRRHVDRANKSQVLPRAPKKGTRSVLWLANSRESFDDSIQNDYEQDTPYKEPSSPDLLYDQLRPFGSSWDHDRGSDYGDATSPDLLKQMGHNSDDSGVNGTRNTDHDYKVIRQKGKGDHQLTHQLAQTNGYDSDFYGFKDKQDRSSTKLSRKTPIPEIHYVPPSSKGRKKHREDPATVFSDETDNDPYGYQDTNYPDHHSSRRNVHRRHPPAQTKDTDLPKRNVKRRPRRSLAQNRTDDPVQKQPHLPQLREEDDQSPTAPRTDRTPRMYDPKRESQDSVINSYSPLPLYMPLSVYESGKIDNGTGGGGSRKPKKAQGLKPRSKIYQPDLLSPLYQQHQKQRRKRRPVSRIPVKTIY